MDRKTRTALSLFAFAMLLAPHAFGGDFDRRSIEQFQLGTTTKAQILEKLGEPESERSFSTDKDIDGHPMEKELAVTELKYRYSEGRADGRAVLPNVFPQRTASLYLVEDTLFAYRSASSFSSDSTAFPYGEALKIKKEKTTEQQIYKVLGPPSGRSTHPLAANPGGRSIHYEVTLWNDPPQMVTKRQLSIYLSQDGVIEDYSVDNRKEAAFPHAAARRFDGRANRSPFVR